MDELKKYLTVLLNREIDESSSVTLTSAQKARFHSWLVANKIDFDHSKLIKKFSLGELLKEREIQYSDSTKPSFNKEISNNLNGFDMGDLGIDIQKIYELFPNSLPVDLKAESDLLAIFSLRELSYAASKNDPKETLTGLYAAKEALVKAGCVRSNLSDIEVLFDHSGRPIFNGYLLSISHSAEYAVAIALNLNLFKSRLEVVQNIDSLDNKAAQQSYAKKYIFYFLRVFELMLLVFLTAYSLQNYYK